MISRTVILVALFCAVVPVTEAATITAPTCSYVDVSAAVASATHGDTIVVPPGSCTWSSLGISKGVTLLGAGVGVTTITSTAGPNSYLIAYDPDGTSISNDVQFRVTGFTLDLNSSSGGVSVRNPSATSAISRVMIHDNSFLNGTSGTCVRTRGQVYGVVYNNTFTNCAIAVRSYGNEGTSWNNFTYSHGGANNLYYEDNVFTGNSVFHYGGQGGRYVARYNTYNFTAGGFQVVWDVHGNQPGGIYATMGAEIYGNTVTLDRSTACVDLRGGTAVIFDNTVTGPACSWQIREEYDDSISPTSNSQPQHVSNSFFWNNRQNGSIVTLKETQDCCNAITENSEYANVVAPSYTPYTYPHPLRGPSPPGSQLPSPPTRLRIVGS